jgi:NADP-dependent 3-hydroxy acid dehydrogenase YdfG
MTESEPAGVGGAAVDNPPLTGTVALVTGASSGIGAATVRRLALEGAAVSLVARRQDRLDELAEAIRQAGGSAHVLVADVTDPQAAASVVQQTVDRFGRLDTLVNNAGVMLLGPALRATTEEWDRMLALNVSALLHVTHAALPHLVAAAKARRAGSRTSSTSARPPVAVLGREAASTT